MTVALWLLRIVAALVALLVVVSLVRSNSGIETGPKIAYWAGLILPLYAIWSTTRPAPTAGRIAAGFAISILYFMFFAITRLLDAFP